jgi:3-hydroxyacyl-CoA dehydrogenase/enoyl-CoA hydratase/3-hydroxybutyryl-CoA epimerase
MVEPFLGGPFRYADTIGIAALVEKLEGYRQRLGERFAPAELLMGMSKDGRGFHPD